MENLNKESLISEVASRTGDTKAHARVMVESVFDTITDCLAEGKKFQYIGFGTFQVKTRAARTGYNPAKKGRQEIPEKSVASFKPGKNLAERVLSVKAIETEEERPKKP